MTVPAAGTGPAPLVSTDRVSVTPGCSQLEGRVRWAPAKSLWVSAMTVAGVIGAVAFFSWSAVGVFLANHPNAAATKAAQDALLVCAWIVAFFPILSNTVVGLRAADAHLRDLFRLLIDRVSGIGPKLAMAVVSEELSRGYIGVGSIAANQLTGGGSGLLGVAFAFGLTIAVMVTATGHISGAHYNPAVTAACWVTKRMDTVEALLYTAAQLAAAVVKLGIFASAATRCGRTTSTC